MKHDALFPEKLVYPDRPRTDRFYLNVPYNNQLDNSPNKEQGPGWRHCNITSAAMLAEYLKPQLWNGYHDFANGAIDALNSVGGDTTDHAAVTRMLRSIGIESYFSYSASMADVAHALFCGVPVLIGTDYKADGHMKLLIGRSPIWLLAHDPYGSRAGISDEWSAIGGDAGAYELISYRWMSHKFVDMGPEAGWARFVTAVDGKPTGVKSEM